MLHVAFCVPDDHFGGSCFGSESMASGDVPRRSCRHGHERATAIEISGGACDAFDASGRQSSPSVGMSQRPRRSVAIGYGSIDGGAMIVPVTPCAWMNPPPPPPAPPPPL